MRHWIEALLDPEPIEQGSKDKGEISSPPKFILPPKGSLLPTQGASSLRKRPRERRSVSPSKMATPSRKMASPRKQRTSRKDVKSEGVSAASSAMQDLLENGTGTDGHEGRQAGGDDTVTVEVDSTVARQDGVETTFTAVKVGMPAHHPDLPLPESTEDMLAKAKDMVEEANKLEGKRVNGVKALKRKADEVEDDDDEEVGHEVQPVKRARVLEQELKKERIKTKALLGLSATLAIG